MANDWRTLSESLEYTKQFAKIDDVARLDEVLTGLTWAISRAPEIFEIIHVPEIRLVKSKGLKMNDGTYAVIRIWFKISNPSEIELLAIHRQTVE